MIIKDDMVLLKKHLLLFFLFSTAIIPAWAGNRAKLSSEELFWIKEHPVIRLTPDSQFAPMEFIENDEYKGISNDFLSIIADRTGLNIVIVEVPDWTQALSFLKERQADMNGALTPSKAREKYLVFTEPVFESKVLIFGTEKTPVNIDPEDLIGKRVGVASGYYEDEYISQNMPEIRPIRYQTYKKALEDLSLGRLDYVIGDLAFISYQKNNLNLSNVYVAGDLGISHSLCFGVRSDWPELRNILQKGYDSISEDEKNEIYEKWTGLKLEDSFISRSVLTAVLYILLLIIIVLILIVMWNRILVSKVEEKTAALNQELEEKTKLLNEVHHRVNNNMQMIIGLLQCGFGEESISRVRILALTQAKAYSENRLHGIDVRELFTDIIREIENDYRKKIVDKIEIETEGFICELRHAVGIALILNEVFLNLLANGILEGTNCSFYFSSSAHDECFIMLELRNTAAEPVLFAGPSDSPSNRLISVMKKDLSAREEFSKLKINGADAVQWRLFIPHPEQN